jgi:hypothetical protein
MITGGASEAENNGPLHLADYSASCCATLLRSGCNLAMMPIVRNRSWPMRAFHLALVLNLKKQTQPSLPLLYSGLRPSPQLGKKVPCTNLEAFELRTWRDHWPQSVGESNCFVDYLLNVNCCIYGHLFINQQRMHVWIATGKST